MSGGILAGLKPAPGSGFRHLRPDEQAALLLIRDIDPFGMVLVDRDGVERVMVIFCGEEGFLFDLVSHRLTAL